jgi:hypothetical protein
MGILRIGGETSPLQCTADTAAQLQHVIYLFVVASEFALPNL